VLVTFALGTAAGDLTATSMGLGFWASAILFAGAISVVGGGVGLGLGLGLGLRHRFGDGRRPAQQRLAADERRRAVGADPIPRAKLAGEVAVLGWLRPDAGAGDPARAGAQRPAPGAQRAERPALQVARQIQRMRTTPTALPAGATVGS
jgi:hypothetical protein